MFFTLREPTMRSKNLPETYLQTRTHQKSLRTKSELLTAAAAMVRRSCVKLPNQVFTLAATNCVKTTRETKNPVARLLFPRTA